MLLRVFAVLMCSGFVASVAIASQAPPDLGQLEGEAMAVHQAVLQAKERISKSDSASPEKSAKARWNEYFKAAEMAFRKGDLLRAQVMLGIAEQFATNLSPLGRDQIEALRIRVYRDWGEGDRGYQHLQSLIARRKLAGLPTDLRVFYLDRLLEQGDELSFEWIFRKFYSKMRGEERSFYRWGKLLLEKKNARLAFLVLSGIRSRSEWYPHAVFLRGIAHVLNGDFSKALSFFQKSQTAAEQKGEKDLAALALLSQGRIYLFLANTEAAAEAFHAVGPDTRYHPEARYELLLMRFGRGEFRESWNISTDFLLTHPLYERVSRFWLAQAYSLLSVDRVEEAYRVLVSLRERYQGITKEVQRLREISRTEKEKSPASSNLEVIHFLDRVRAQAEQEYRRVGLGGRMDAFTQELSLAREVWQEVMIALLPGCSSRQSAKESCRLERIRSDLINLEAELENVSQEFLPAEVWGKLKDTSPPREFRGVQAEIEKMGSTGNIDLARLIGAMKREEEAVKSRRRWIAWVRKELKQAEAVEPLEGRKTLHAAWGTVLEAETGLGLLEKKIVARETENYLKYNPLIKKLAVTLPGIETKLKTIKSEADRIRQGIDEVALQNELQGEEEVFLQGIAVLNDISVQRSHAVPGKEEGGSHGEEETSPERFVLQRQVTELKLADRLNQLEQNVIVKLLGALEEDVLEYQKVGLFGEI